jgi:hypothetical protein
VIPTERVALIAYLIEQRRHLLAQVKACEDLIAVIDVESNKCYNKNERKVNSEKAVVK